METARRFSRRVAPLVLLAWLLVTTTSGPAGAASSERFSFENAELSAVVKHVAHVTGIAFLFDPERVVGKITLVSPTRVSAAEALELLKSALALHGYRLLPRAEAIWIVPAEPGAPEGFAVKVLPLRHARAGELAYTLSRIAPPSVRVVPYYPTNSLIVSGHPAAVEALIGVIE
jgi:general secretion pathway protein D